MTILDLHEKKQNGKKISMITCYDYTFAQILNSTDIDCLLVGDSLAMVMHGYPTTLNASIEMMVLHTAAVVKGAPQKLVVGDLPFLSYRKSLSENMSCVEQITKAGAQAVKLEGALGNIDFIKHCVDSGVPVMGHLGLTPQSIHQLGGFKVQGRDEKAKKLIFEHALQLQDAGCFSLVLECVPSDLAKQITQELNIPTIGIGAGVDCDGQVLVLQDMLGMNQGFSPKFLRKYFNGAEELKKAFNQYHHDVVNGQFPNQKESYS
ncbi:MAG: 3-methyl-2-oxobutanoate hydroxymethyltransferase [Bdellovibrionaceae bacterium]|nr:3-methyl-2-oxobutanoate hydroxymethyltransferase [Pseudobdellovibrionaceae bacterium]